MSEEDKLEWACRQIEALLRRTAELEASASITTASFMEWWKQYGPLCETSDPRAIAGFAWRAGYATAAAVKK